jgi:hypothetical protein
LKQKKKKRSSYTPISDAILILRLDVVKKERRTEIYFFFSLAITNKGCVERNAVIKMYFNGILLVNIDLKQ